MTILHEIQFFPEEHRTITFWKCSENGFYLDDPNKRVWPLRAEWSGPFRDVRHISTFPLFDCRDMEVYFDGVQKGVSYRSGKWTWRLRENLLLVYRPGVYFDVYEDGKKLETMPVISWDEHDEWETFLYWLRNNMPT